MTHRWTRRRIWALLGWIVLIVSLGANATFRAERDTKSRSDVTVYRLAARALLDHSPLYEVRNDRGYAWLYPPGAAVLFRPLAPLSPNVAAALFYLFSVGCAAGAVALGARCLARAPSPDRDRATWGAVGFCGFLFVDVLTRGQIDLLILLGVMLALFGSLEGRAALAGIGFGLAVSIKPTPAALLVLFFLARRDWRFLLWCVVGFAFFFALVPILYFGYDLASDLVGQWMRGTVRASLQTESWNASGSPAPAVFHALADPARRNNQSISAACVRAIDFLSGGNGSGSRSLARGIAWALSGGLLLLSLPAWVARAETRTARLAQGALPIALLLISAPLARDDYFVALFPLVLALFAWRVTAPSVVRRRLDRWLWIAGLLLNVPLLFAPVRVAAPLLFGSLILGWQGWLLARRGENGSPGAP